MNPGNKYTPKILTNRIPKFNIKARQDMSKFNDFFNKLDRQKYPFIDGLYYLFIILFIAILFLFFA